jgi:hypothetical protein
MNDAEFERPSFLTTTGSSLRVRPESIKRERPAVEISIKMSSRVRQVLPKLKRLNRLAKKSMRRYLKICGGPFVDCVCECTRNLLKGTVPLRSKQMEALRCYKRLLRKAASKKTPRKERRRIIQKGEFIFSGAILHPLIAGLGLLLGSLVSRLAGNKTR